MTSKIVCGAAALYFASALLPAASQQEAIPEGHVTTLPEPAAPATATKSHPFAALAGSWSGGGTIDLTNDIHERLRCRANYTHGPSNTTPVLAPPSHTDRDTHSNT